MTAAMCRGELIKRRVALPEVEGENGARFFGNWAESDPFSEYEGEGRFIRVMKRGGGASTPIRVRFANPLNLTLIGPI